MPVTLQQQTLLIFQMVTSGDITVGFEADSITFLSRHTTDYEVIELLVPTERAAKMEKSHHLKHAKTKYKVYVKTPEISLPFSEDRMIK
jgi:hypothetical protein